MMPAVRVSMDVVVFFIAEDDKTDFFFLGVALRCMRQIARSWRIKNFESNIFQMITIDEDLECKWTYQIKE